MTIRTAPLLAGTTLALLLAGCAPAATTPTSPSTSAASSTSSPTVPAASPSPGSPTATPAEPTPAVTVDITIAGGKVSPVAKTVRVGRGETVRVTAVSDVEESVHIHGYDRTLTLSPGRPAQVSFPADQSGVFEIETHDSGTLVAKLTVG